MNPEERKTIFVTMCDGAVAKNFLHTGVIKRLSQEFRVVLFVTAVRAAYYRDKLPDISVETPPRPDHPFLEQVFARVLLYGLHTESIAAKIRLGKSLGDKLPFWLFKRIVWELGRFKIFRRTLRAAYSLVPDRSFDQLIIKYSPALVFAADMISIDDARLLKAARRFKVPSIGMPKSWDNLTTKTFFNVLPDQLLVQNHVMKGDAMRHMDMKVDNIEVVGFPQFDIYTERKDVPNREEFCKSLGLDPSKKIILYAAAGHRLAPNDEEVLRDLVDSFALDKLDARTQILVRPHPKYRFKDELFSNISFLKVDYPGFLIGPDKLHWEFDLSDVRHLRNSLIHADVVVNTASTLIIEAAIFDKPIIAIDYDGHATLPRAQRVGRHYEFEHLQHILRVGGLKLVRNASEIAAAVREYLDYPAHDQSDRRRIVELEVPYLGKAAQNTFDAIMRFYYTC